MTSSQQSQPSTAASHSPLMAVPGTELRRVSRGAAGCVLLSDGPTTHEMGTEACRAGTAASPLRVLSWGPVGVGVQRPPSGSQWGWRAVGTGASVVGGTETERDGTGAATAQRQQLPQPRGPAEERRRHSAHPRRGDGPTPRRAAAMLRAAHGRARPRSGLPPRRTTGGTAGRSPPSRAGGREPRDELRWPRSTGASPPAPRPRRRGSRCRVTPCCFGCSSASASALC